MAGIQVPTVEVVNVFDSSKKMVINKSDYEEMPDYYTLWENRKKPKKTPAKRGRPPKTAEPEKKPEPVEKKELAEKPEPAKEKKPVKEPEPEKGKEPAKK